MTLLAIGEPASASTRAHFATVAVEGVALGRFTMADGRPGDTAWQATETVEHFAPGTVPILTRHDGLWLGDVATLRADGPDLRFTGAVLVDDELEARLRRGVPISVAFVEAFARRWDGQPRAGQVASLEARKPCFRGAIGPGRNLVEIAIEDRPAARGSFMWIPA